MGFDEQIYHNLLNLPIGAHNSKGNHGDDKVKIFHLDALVSNIESQNGSFSLFSGK